MSTDAALHAHTPTILARESRGVTVRRVAYHRRVAAEVAEPRVDRVERKLADRVRDAWDARLPHPCGSTMHALSGAALRSAHVDAGWRVALNGVANEPAYAWDARGVMRRFVHDACGRPVAAHEGVGATRCVERLTYGAAFDATGGAGRLVRHDDTSGTVQVAAYSLHGSTLVEHRRFLSSLDIPDWPEVVDARDALLENEAFESRWRYDARGVPWQQTDAGGHVRRYIVDIAGRALTLQVTLESGAERSVSTGAAYDAEGHLIGRRDGDVAIVAQFDPASGHQVGLRRTVAGRAIQDLTYEYDGVGNVTSMTDAASATDWFDPADTDPVHRYDYDTLDQLVHATGRESVRVDGTGGAPDPLLPGDAADHRLRDYVEEYSYDAGGNLVTLAHTAANATVTRRFTIEASSNRAVPVGEEGAIAYDATGNRLHLRPGVPMQWDVRRRLAAVASAPDDERYLYDASGMRARKHSATGDVRYLPGMERRTTSNHGSCDVMHLPHAGGLTRIVHWRSGKPDTDVQDLARIQVADLLGSVCVEVTTDGTVLSDEAFHPFGSSARWAARDATTADGKVRRYGGKETDATGLSYYGHRYYAPWLGRWISPDPAGDIDGPNRYRFARNNPCSGIDRDGRIFRYVKENVEHRMASLRLRPYREMAVARSYEAVERQLANASRDFTAPVDLSTQLANASRTIGNVAALFHTNTSSVVRDRVTRHLGLHALTDEQWEKTRDVLVEGFNHMHRELADLSKRDSRRLILIDLRTGSGDPLEGARAFTSPGDRKGRIVINRIEVQYLGTPPLAKTLIHELSHLLPGSRRTFDLIYFDPEQSMHEAAEFTPPAWPPSPLSMSPDDRAVRAIGMAYSGMDDSERKRSLLLRNADTWPAIAFDLEKMAGMR